MEFNNRKVENSDEDKDLWARASEVWFFKFLLLFICCLYF